MPPLTMPPLNVTGTLDSLDPIADYVISVANSVGLDKKAAYKLRLAVDEVATNIILHGYEEAGLEGSIQLAAQIDEQTLSIILEDTAHPYDPYQTETVSESDLELPLEERAIGGLGVYLAIESVDQFQYERQGDLNRNILTVKRPVPAESA